MSPFEFRVVFYLARDGEPSASLRCMSPAGTATRTQGNVVAIAEALLRMARIYEHAAELAEAVQTDAADAPEVQRKITELLEAP
jgi:hypothetical protein